MNDLQCIEAIKNGNINAFEYIVNRYKAMVFTIAIKVVNSRHTAEDITQDVFIKVFKSLNKFQNKSAFSTWIYRIAYNTSISEIKKKRFIFTKDGEIYDVANDDDNYELNNFSKENLLQYLEKIISKLPPEDALLLDLFYHGKQSVEQISEISGLSSSNVKVKLHRIRKKVYDELNKQIRNEQHFR